MAPCKAASSKTLSNLSLKYKSCNVSKCLCPFKDKRYYQIEFGSWEIVQCKSCSFFGTHRLCSFIQCFQDWRCRMCYYIAATKNLNDSLPTFRKKLLSLNMNDLDTILKTVRHLKTRSCSLEKCLCPYQEKQEYQEKIGSWEILLCHTCGIYGTHRICSFVKCFEAWYCKACQAKHSRYH